MDLSKKSVDWLLNDAIDQNRKAVRYAMSASSRKTAGATMYREYEACDKATERFSAVMTELKNRLGATVEQ